MNSLYTLDASELTTKGLNKEIQELANFHPYLRLVNPMSRHNIGIGLPPNLELCIEGSAGYYCAGLNTRATVTVTGDVSWGVGECMSSGHVTVGGYAGTSAGAAMLGGLIHIKRDAGPRTGVAMKGGCIVVGGLIGAHAGLEMRACQKK
ncbi:hypothetical protein [Acidithiobacillus sp. AMEEHan]|uniref:GltB/FmdC/FwdC-like GXGXG domain-containing protein n=1 Tax=Acidithiobacillus sp. AMEEHan TaxID=2994951 RepID=UPI0027E55A70|nr:hypothetical protein [Acidithiobacillus sp. AMEEHan]